MPVQKSQVYFLHLSKLVKINQGQFTHLADFRSGSNTHFQKGSTWIV